jgi:uncharacterized protein YndB with AHSA1/START domain
MPQQSFEPRRSAAATATDHGPVLEHSPQGDETAGQRLRIRATRHYAVPRDDVFAAWTSRTAWDSWMRLRARSRAAIAAYPGGAFRLELAEGPTIHVVTGVFVEFHAPDHLRLVWLHHSSSDDASTIDVAIRSRLDGTELTLTHLDIASRREAAWLMRLWSTVLRRLGDYVAVAQVHRPLQPRRALTLVGAASATGRAIPPASSRL